MAARPEPVTQSLLERAYSPDAARAVFENTILHRPLLLRATSPPAADAGGARATRRRARELARQRRKIKPQPLSARRCRALGLYDLPAQRGGAVGSGEPSAGHADKQDNDRSGGPFPKEKRAAGCPKPNNNKKRNYAVFEPLHRMWLGYMHEILGSDVYTGGPAAAAKLAAAEFHGAEVEVVRSGCVSRVGIRGIVVKDAKFVFEIVTEDGSLKIVPKEGTVFRVRIPAEQWKDESRQEQQKQQDQRGQQEQQREQDQQQQQQQQQQVQGGTGRRTHLVFDIHGSQFQVRAADRSSKKFKQHFLSNI